MNDLSAKGRLVLVIDDETYRYAFVVGCRVRTGRSPAIRRGCRGELERRRTVGRERMSNPSSSRSPEESSSSSFRRVPGSSVGRAPPEPSGIIALSAAIADTRATAFARRDHRCRAHI